MDNIKNDAYYLQKLRKDISFVNLHMKGISEEDFESDEVLQDSMTTTAYR